MRRGRAFAKGAAGSGRTALCSLYKSRKRVYSHQQLVPVTTAFIRASNKRACSR